MLFVCLFVCLFARVPYRILWSIHRFPNLRATMDSYGSPRHARRRQSLIPSSRCDQNQIKSIIKWYDNCACSSSASYWHAFKRSHCGLARHFKTDPTEDTLPSSWWQLSSRSDEQAKYLHCYGNKPIPVHLMACSSKWQKRVFAVV
jgi:hypothetical protein